jgi:hypothetical protein
MDAMAAEKSRASPPKIRHQITCGSPKPQPAKNGTVPGREGLNTILAATQHEDFGGQEPVCASGAHIY